MTRILSFFLINFHQRVNLCKFFMTKCVQHVSFIKQMDVLVISEITLEEISLHPASIKIQCLTYYIIILKIVTTFAVSLLYFFSIR